VYIEECPAGKQYCFINTEYNFISHAVIGNDSPSTMNVDL